MKTLQRTEDPAFARDLRTKAVINTDDQSYAAFLAERSQRMKMIKAVSEVDDLKRQLEELRSVVALLTTGKIQQNGSS